MNNLIIRNLVIRNLAGPDIFIEAGRCVATPAKDAKVIDGAGLTALPSITDSRVFAIDATAMARGGITAVGLMPDQSPVLDTAQTIAHAAQLGGETLAVHPLCAATKALQGIEIAEIGLGQLAGAVAISTGRAGIASTLIMQRLLSYAKRFNLTVISHTEDVSLTAGAVATEGEFATRLGLSAAPSYAEALAVQRDTMLCEMIGAKLHIAQATTRQSLEIIRAAKTRGVHVTCGVTPAHFMLNHVAAAQWHTGCHVSPPLRSEDDRLAVIEAITDGTVDIIASGHDPWPSEAKRLPFAESAPGMAIAEYLLPLALTLVHADHISMDRLTGLLCTAPAKLLGLNSATLAVGAPADLVLVDINAPIKIPAQSQSGFGTLPLSGRVMLTMKNGQVAFKR